MLPLKQDHFKIGCPNHMQYFYYLSERQTLLLGSKGEGNEAYWTRFFTPVIFCCDYTSLTDTTIMGTILTFSPSIATAYHVDPCYLALHGFGLDYEYVIKLNDIECHLVANDEGEMVTSNDPLPFYCTKGHEIGLEMLPISLQSKLGLI